MTSDATETTNKGGLGWGALLRFLPYLWPKDEPKLRARVVVAVLLVLAAKAATLTMPFAYKAAIDRMSAGMERGRRPIAIALVIAYAGARFGGVLFDNLRNAIFERVGQDAARRLAETVFRHIHALSLRFHLERRTGALTKIVERGTKSIDMMLYFLLFNIAPTLIELTAICIIFGVKFGPGLVAATLVMVVAYIWFTRVVTEWRTKLQRRDERGRQPGDRARGRFAAQLRDGQIFQRRGARGAALRPGRAAPMPTRRSRTRSRSPGSISASR